MIRPRTFLFEQAPETANGGGGAPPPAWHEAILTKGQDGTESLTDPAQWLDRAPKPLADFVRSNMTAARQKTEGLVKVPGEGATPEEIAAYYKAIGVPEKPEDYGLKPPEKLPDGLQHDAEMEKAFLSRARELGLTKSQVAALRDFQINYLGESVAKNRAAMAQVIEAEKAELTKRFGDKLDGTIAEAKALANQKWVPEGMKKYLTGGAVDPQSGDFAGADFLEFVAAAARATGEDRGAGGIRGAGSAAVDLAQAKDIMTNPKNPLHSEYIKGTGDVFNRVTAAYKAAFPG